ncbi:MAG TPA: hypothetical protein VM240_11800 [Verrucomicrobiae bacterium]|nr:hypothetical protein [Verrucomicrobiae bacterium]
MSGALIVSRRLAIALMAEAQKASDEVRGVIGARDGVPTSVCPGASEPKSGEIRWARYHSGAQPDGAPGRQLLITLDTKGVLQLRCWDAGAEVELRIL